MNFGWVAAVLAGGLVMAGCEKKPAGEPPRAIQVRPGAALELRLATFNVRYENEEDRGERNWRARLLPVVKAIRAMQPDVFGVQEALHGQVADLRASLPEFGFHGIGRDDGERAGEYSGIFFRADRFEPDRSDAGTFWLSDTPETPGSKTWGNEIPRIASWLRLVDRVTGRGLYVFNTHWDHRNQASRERAAMLLSRRIDGRRHAGDPVVLTGDFNAVEGNNAVAYLRGKPVTLAGRPQTWANGLVDAFDARNPGRKDRTTLHFWSGSRACARNVDHILVPRGSRVLAAEIVTGFSPWPSDHFPVSARVVLPAHRPG